MVVLDQQEQENNMNCYFCKDTVEEKQDPEIYKDWKEKSLVPIIVFFCKNCKYEFWKFKDDFPENSEK